VIAGLYFSIKYSNGYFQFDSADQFQHAAIFILSFGAFLLIVNQIGSVIGRIAERNLDAIYETSYINLSNSDITLVKNSAKTKRNALAKAIVSVALTLAIGIVSSLISKNLV